MISNKSLLEQRWTVVVGVLIGVLISPASQGFWGVVLAAYDMLRPVVVLVNATIVDKGGDEVTVGLIVRKGRECDYIRLQAFGARGDEPLKDAYMRRLDVPENGATKPRGTFDIGTWRIWPTSGASSVIVYAQHDCSGRIVQTKLAEVAL
jgi:hypothetical protein